MEQGMASITTGNGVGPSSLETLVASAVSLTSNVRTVRRRIASQWIFYTTANSLEKIFRLSLLISKFLLIWNASIILNEATLLNERLLTLNERLFMANCFKKLWNPKIMMVHIPTIGNWLINLKSDDS